MKLTIQEEILNRDLAINGFILLFKIHDMPEFVNQLKNYNPKTEGLKTLIGISPQVIGTLNINGFGVKQFNEDKVFSEEFDSLPNSDIAIWVKAEDPGKLLKDALALKRYFSATTVINAIRLNTYQYHYDKTRNSYINRGLEGFEDGTVNPTEDSLKMDAEEASIIKSAGHVCGSLWVIQKWQHDFEWLDKASVREKEALIGRTMTDSKEIEERLPTAHISRTDQDSFSPNTRIWRRSMPWFNDQLEGGLLFSCFTNDLSKFEKQFQRMTGNNDGLKDGIFTFSKVLFTNYFWTPPVDKEGKIILDPLAI